MIRVVSIVYNDLEEFLPKTPQQYVYILCSYLIPSLLNALSIYKLPLH